MVGLACVDMSAPSGVASISTLQLPSPFVAVGDTMRDSNGVAAPITVIAYDGAGIPIDGAPVQVFITDTTRSAHLTPANFLIGDTIGTTRLLGQIGSLQTPFVTVFVTFTPAKLVPSATPPDTARPPVGPASDSTASLGFSDITAFVRSAEDSASRGVIVKFRVIRTPENAPSATSATVFFIDPATNKPSARDTSDASGAVSRRLAVDGRMINGEVWFGNRVDSAVVELEANYKGVPLTNSPLRFVVPIRGKGIEP